jgi:hypothetical protein
LHSPFSSRQIVPRRYDTALFCHSVGSPSAAGKRDAILGARHWLVGRSCLSLPIRFCMLRGPFVAISMRRRPRMRYAIGIALPRSRRSVVDLRSALLHLDGLDQILEGCKSGFIAGSQLPQKPAFMPCGEQLRGQAAQPSHRSTSCSQDEASGQA